MSALRQRTGLNPIFDTTVTLADATVFPPGSPPHEVPLLRIRLAQVAGWWLVPTDAEGKASSTHPSAG